MSDVKVERKEAVSRDEAASWLTLLSQAFTGAATRRSRSGRAAP
jgi:hypothetical protein